MRQDDGPYGLSACPIGKYKSLEEGSRECDPLDSLEFSPKSSDLRAAWLPLFFFAAGTFGSAVD